VNRPAAIDEAMPYACDACDRGFPTLAALRVHAVMDERRVLTPAEQAGSAQLSLFAPTPKPQAMTDMTGALP
jgi:hypothetical protein